MIDEFHYDDVKVENIPTKSFYCGECNRVMEEVSRRETVCNKCGKTGWDVNFECPSCQASGSSFQQDLITPPFCYCNT